MLQPGETTAATAIVPEALEPQSLAWKHAGDNLQLLMAGTTRILQVAHPVVGVGVEQHSVFKTDPWGRLQRTTEWGLRLLYGGSDLLALNYLQSKQPEQHGRIDLAA